MKTTSKRCAIFALAVMAAFAGFGRTVNVKTGVNGKAGAVGNGVTDDWTAFHNVFSLALTSSEPLEVVVPAGTYAISEPLLIFSNTTITLDKGATIRRTAGSTAKGLLTAHHVSSPGTRCPMDATCRHGGYTQVQNVTISGGTWDVGAAADELTYVFRLVHGQNITIKNLVCRGSTEHFMNLSGTKDVTIENVTFEKPVKYTGSDPEFWGGEAGDESRYNTVEAVHLDFISMEGEAYSYPVDDTPCQNVTVKGCTFDGVFAGVGTHRHDLATVAGGVAEQVKYPAKQIKVQGCTFKNLLSYAFSAYFFEDSSFTGNNVTGGDIGVSVLRGSSVEIKNNTFQSTGSHSVCMSAQKGESVNVTVSGNTITRAGAQAIYVGGAIGVLTGLDKVVATVDNNTIVSPVINGVYINGGKATVTGCNISGAGLYGICAANGATVDASGNTISASVNSGIYALDAKGVSLTGNIVTNSSNCGMQLGGYSERAVVKNNSILAVKSHGISVTDGLVATISGNTFDGVGNNGVTVTSGADVTLESNTFKGVTRNGLDVSDSARIVAHGNTLTSVGGYGFCAQEKGFFEAQQNVIASPGDSAVRLVGAGECVFADNTITDAGNCAYHVGNTQCSIIGGSVNGTASHGIVASGNGTRVVVRDGEYSSLGGYGFYSGSMGELELLAPKVDGSKSDMFRCESSATIMAWRAEFKNAKGHGVCVLTGGYVEIHSSTFDTVGDAVGKTAGHALYAEGADSHIFCDGSTFTGIVKNGINADKGAGIEVMDSSFATIGGHGICSQSASTVDATRVKLSSVTGHGLCAVDERAEIMFGGGEVARVGKNGADVQVEASIMISSSTFTGVTGHGFCASANGRIEVVDSTMTSPGQYGAYFLNCQGATLYGNTFSGTGAYAAVYANSVEEGQLSVEGNTIINPSGRGIYVQDTQAVKIRANKITGSTTEGIFIKADKKSVYYITVESNDIAGASGIGIRIEGSTSNTDIRAIGTSVNGNAVQSYGAADIRICDNCSRTQVAGNSLRNAGFTVAVSSMDSLTYTPGDAYITAAKYISNTSAEITWDKTTRAQSLILEYADNPDFSGAESVVLRATEAMYTINGLDAENDWYVRVRTSEMYNGQLTESPGSEATARMVAANEDVVLRTSASGNGVAVTGYSGTLVRGYDIPEEIGGKPVVEISAAAFFSARNLMDVRIPSGVKTIGARAFASCPALGFVILPQRFEGKLDSSVFNGASASLVFEYYNVERKVVFDPNGGDASEYDRVLQDGDAIGELPWAGREGMSFAGWFTSPSGGSEVTASTVPEMDETYYAHWNVARWNCEFHGEGAVIKSYDGATGVVFVPASVSGRTVVGIKDYAFFGAEHMTDIVIPSGVTNIGIKAFKNCSSLTSITLPAGLENLGQAAFQGCSSLESVTLPQGITYLWSNIFEDCTSLQSASLPEGLTAIGTSSFANCPSLEEIEVPSTVHTIKSFAFFSCSSLVSVYLPDGLKTIEQKAFKNCTSLESIDLPDITSLGKAAFFNTGLTSAIVPGTVAKVDDYCFQKCADLQLVILEEGIKQTGSSVWANDDNLEEVVFPSTIQNLGAYAFFRCPSLYSLPDFDSLGSLATIGEKAFKHCASLETLAIPSQITAVPKEMCNYCESLQSVTGTKNVKSYGQSAFSNCPSLAAIAGLSASELAAVKKGRALTK